MEVWILDSKYETVGLVDMYKSFLFADRFNTTGDFELVVPASKERIDLLKEGRYIEIMDKGYEDETGSPLSASRMIIECVQIDTDIEEGIFLTITGRDLKSILDRRIVWNKITYNGSVQDLIERILNENFISPSNQNRKISNFTFKKSNDDKVKNATVSDVQYHGENVLEVIEGLCKEKDLGYRINPYGEGGFEFELYSGTDRSYNQELLPWVVFSPDYDNLAGSSSTESKIAYKNAALVFGTEIGDTKTQYTTEATTGSFSGLDRREASVDSSGVSKQDEAGNEIPDSTYLTQLSSKGKKALADLKITKVFTGTINAIMQFVYGRDFFLGDITSVADSFGKDDAVRVTEVIISDDTSGLIITPSFTFSEGGN